MAVLHAPQRRGAAQRAVTPPGQPSREPRLKAGADSHGRQRLAAAPEALVGASAAQRMLAELNQLARALTAALHRRGAAQRAVLLPAEPVTPSLEPRGESSP